ncbi:1-phosphofructokinase family hexose kinase [Limimaricola litoreus]|uniref:Phosphofructokinase n=1 Tax=Limimaricola litoreus TaxID=2955316 RepID=A0A9X2JQ49_9RHOB|nr:hexose kinase [Limimaricola litoreus]MCP1170263.1 hexose kinase [Limimaricola litoreus]
MRPILTITLNPALDLSTETGALVADRKLRCTAPRLDPGGGGVNVSRAVLRLGGRSTAVVALAGATGETIAGLLAREGIDVAALAVEGLTRQSIAITERETGRQYRFILPGPDWRQEATERLFEELDRRLEAGHLVVLSGSLPPGFDPALIARLRDDLRARRADLLLDLSGPALIRTVRDHGPAPFHLIRMDGDEAEELSGRRFTTPRDLVDFGRTLLDAGVAERVVMALGKQGTAGVSAEGAFFCTAPQVEAVSMVGAGDSLMGAVAQALSGGAAFREAVRAGTAAAAAAVTTPATQLCDGALAQRLIEEVRLVDLD